VEPAAILIEWPHPEDRLGTLRDEPWLALQS
jgi:hypothetical protein